jgi:DNA-binding NarL/FixJ family response regulator
MNNKQLSPNAAEILRLIADGFSYEDIVQYRPQYTYTDIRDAAAEALAIRCEEAGTESAPKQRPMTDERLKHIRRKYPRAYMPWDKSEERELVALFKGGAAVKDIADKLQRQHGAIESRLRKLGLIEDDNTKRI